MHETTFTVRSTQVDTFGHLNNAAFLEIYEWARWEWLEDQAAEVLRQIENDHVGPAILAADLRFLKEIRMHDRITVRSWMDSMRTASAVIGQEMVNADGDVVATVRITFVMFHLLKRRTAPMPKAFKRLFEENQKERAENDTD